MTPDEFRSSAPWKRARELAKRGATFCAICHEPLRPDVDPRHRLATTVDHVIPLSSLDLKSAAGRAAAVNQEMLRVVHNSCNARRGDAGASRRRAGRSPRRVQRADPAEWLGPVRSNRW